MEQIQSSFGDWALPIFVLLILLAIACAELISTGYKRSSLYLALNPKKTEWWDIFSWATAAFGLRKLFANIFLFGLFSVLQRFAAEHLQMRLSLEIMHQGNYLICFALAFLLRDFLLYARHRLRHSNAWFWNFHEFHHSAKRISLLTTNRVHFLDSFTYFFMVVLPIQIVFGMQIHESILFELAGWVFGMLNHSRIDSGYGWLGKHVLISPREHHLHHEKEREHKNFGECFVFWDKMFGTYERNEKSIFEMSPGIADDFYHDRNPLFGLFLPVWRLYAIPFSSVARSLKAKRGAKKSGPSELPAR